MGVIDAVGEGVDASRIGQRVWLWNAAWGRAMGTAAQAVVLPQAQAVELPAGVPDEAGACLGIPALTALHAVMMAGGVQGRRVLVTGGAGAVGHYALQFARLLGASQVITTVSNAEKAAIAQAAGADVAINYRSDDVAVQLRQATDGQGVDRIIEVDIAANGTLGADLLRPGGQMVVYGSGASPFSLPFFPLIVKNLSLHFFIVYNLSDDDRRQAQSMLTRLLEQGVLMHQIAARLPLSQLVQAHELVESGRAVGNVVVDMR
jgi:NADPH2:quinone reductase